MLERAHTTGRITCFLGPSTVSGCFVLDLQNGCSPCIDPMRGVFDEAALESGAKEAKAWHCDRTVPQCAGSNSKGCLLSVIAHPMSSHDLVVC